jgi:hypothetical protein
MAEAIPLDKDVITAFHSYPFDHKLCGSETILLSEFFSSPIFGIT